MQEFMKCKYNLYKIQNMSPIFRDRRRVYEAGLYGLESEGKKHLTTFQVSSVSFRKRLNRLCNACLEIPKILAAIV